MSKPVTSLGGIDFKRVFLKYAKNWYIFAIAIMLAYVSASNTNRYIIPIYSLKTSILIEDKSNTSVLEERGAISASPIYLSSKLIENQIAFLKSYAQIKRIIEKLDFEVSYYSKEKYIYSEIYKQSPFVVWFDRNHWQPRYQQIRVKFLSPDKFQLSTENGAFDVPKTFNVGDTIRKKDYCFVLNLKDDTDAGAIQNKEFAFVINDINGIVGNYMNSTGVYIERNTSMLVISSKGPNKQKEKDYLNQLTTEFLLSNLEKKNKILTNTINFIEKQLVQFRKDLNETEQEIEEFRKKHNFMMLQEKIGSLLKNLDEESKDSKNLRIDLEYYRYLLNYVEEREDLDDIVMPSSMGVNLPMFNALIGKLSLSIQEKNTLIANSTRSNPYLQILERDIAVMKEACVESMKSTIETTELKLFDTERRMWSLNQEFMKLPRLEREFLTIQRKYKIINDLYDFLLKRKSEVEIQRAANTPDHEIVDYAGDTGISKISPGPKTAYINAMIWAILLPAVFLFMLVFFNNRIMSPEDVASITIVPIAGLIGKSTNVRLDGVLRSPNSYLTELLRIIRIKLNLNSEKNEKIVAVTSSSIGEGKTFFAANLASVYALAGKRTLLMGFDFRRPGLADEFGLDPLQGITSFLINEIPLEDVIQHTFTRNLDILLAGPIPPNPDELIESEKTRFMFEELRKKYSFIVMDTPAIGLFGDAFLLNKYCDANVFIVRHNFTRKNDFTRSINDAVNNTLKKLFIVYNDANIKIKGRNIGIYDEQIPAKFFIVRAAVKFSHKFVVLLKSFKERFTIFDKKKHQNAKRAKVRNVFFVAILPFLGLIWLGLQIGFDTPTEKKETQVLPPTSKSKQEAPSIAVKDPLAKLIDEIADSTQVFKQRENDEKVIVSTSVLDNLISANERENSAATKVADSKPSDSKLEATIIEGEKTNFSDSQMRETVANELKRQPIEIPSAALQKNEFNNLTPDNLLNDPGKGQNQSADLSINKSTDTLVPMRFYIVTGSFEELEKANNLIKKLESEGFKPSLAGQSANGFYRVSIADYLNKEEAFAELEKLKKIYNPGMWILRK